MKSNINIVMDILVYVSNSISPILHIISNRLSAQKGMVSAVSSRDVRTSLTSDSSLRSLNRTGSSDLLRAENRRSVQARYNFQIDKNDLNENVDDIMKNFDVFSQFATQQIASEDSIDVSGAGESFDGAATPTNSETPMDSRSLDDR